MNEQGKSTEGLSTKGATSKQTDRLRSEGNTSDKQLSADKVTTVEKTVKVKDPRKVELGKRLAKISREAKERKAKQHEDSKIEKEVKSEEKEITDYIDFRYFIGGVTLVAALGGLYYSYKRDKREIKEEKVIVNNEKIRMIMKLIK